MVARLITEAVNQDFIPKKLTLGGCSFHLTRLFSRCLAPLSSGLYVSRNSEPVSSTAMSVAY